MIPAQTHHLAMETVGAAPPDVQADAGSTVLPVMNQVMGGTKLVPSSQACFPRERRQQDILRLRPLTIVAIS